MAVLMDKQPKQLDVQVLVDWLAKETQRYTKAFISGKQDEIIRCKTIMDALITEIRRRKKDGLLPPGVVTGLPPDDFFEAAP
jgi:hypothetical protein